MNALGVKTAVDEAVDRLMAVRRQLDYAGRERALALARWAALKSEVMLRKRAKDDVNYIEARSEVRRLDEHVAQLTRDLERANEACIDARNAWTREKRFERQPAQGTAAHP